MEPALVPLTATRGATWRETWRFYLDDAATTPVDFTNFDAQMDVRDSPTDAGALLVDLSTSNGRLTFGTGTILPVVDDSVTQQWKAGEYFYDLKLFDASSEPEVWMRGCFSVRERVTS